MLSQDNFSRGSLSPAGDSGTGSPVLHLGKGQSSSDLAAVSTAAPPSDKWILHSELKDKMQAVATLPGTFYQQVGELSVYLIPVT